MSVWDPVHVVHTLPHAGLPGHVAAALGYRFHCDFRDCRRAGVLRLDLSDGSDPGPGGTAAQAARRQASTIWTGRPLAQGSEVHHAGGDRRRLLPAERTVRDSRAGKRELELGRHTGQLVDV